MKCKKIVVKGFVQGIFFRYKTKKNAEQLGLKGYVKNLDNGDVEVIACGEKVNKLIEWCKKGPKIAKVDKVIIEECEGDYTDFSIEY